MGNPFSKPDENDAIPKIKYKIGVKTGDKKFAGNNSSVAIVLHGEGRNSEKIWMNHILKDDFERGNTDEFTITALQLNRVDFIELFRGFSIFDQWFVDEVTVTEAKSGHIYVFPIHRWLKPRASIKIQLLDTVLPQFDKFPEQRKQELDLKREEYELEVKVPGLPAQAKTMPSDEKFSISYTFDIAKKEIFAKIAAWKTSRFIPGERWKSLEHLYEAYTPGILPVPGGCAKWREDIHFGHQRLAGVNCIVIELCTNIPEKFPVTDEMVQCSLEGMTLQEAMDQKKLFIVDYEILTGLPCREGLTVCDPIALFFVNGENNLMPIAIQLKQKPSDDNPIFLPSDPEYTWLAAKMWFNNSDTAYHQAVTHLGFTHLVVEGVCLATHRQMSLSHPIFKLLAPHFLYVIAVNAEVSRLVYPWQVIFLSGFALAKYEMPRVNKSSYFPTTRLALVKLVAPGQWIDTAMNAGRLGIFELVKRQFANWRLNVEGTFPEFMRSKGVLSSDVLPKYYFRDDSLKLYEAIKEYVTNYVSIYYDTEEKLTEDWELQRWITELRTPTEEGGVGLLGVPVGECNTIDNIDQLIQILTSIIHIASVAHGAANFQQYDEYAYPPNYPAYMGGEPPKNKTALTEKDLLDSLPDQHITLSIMIITQILSEKATNSLGYFEVMYMHDPKALDCLNKFRDRLKEIADEMQEAERDPAYTWLLPKNIPNAISI